MTMEAEKSHDLALLQTGDPEKQVVQFKVLRTRYTEGRKRLMFQLISWAERKNKSSLLPPFSQSGPP